ncbi:MAG: endonuclease/exonuclease/phosphatase family protein [Bacteroidia bacterium]|nr:endonuclease/exonuclease/phosphatase family protein [Bacteroidia bacterium]
MKGLRFFDWFLLPFSLLVWVVAGMSTMAAYITPGKYWVISLSGIVFPFLFLLNFIFLIFWLSRRKWLLLSFHLIVFVTGFKTFNVQWAWNSITKTKSDSDFTVLSFNARNFDFYNWSGNYFGTSTIRQDAMDMIRKLNPDIICFQEFFHCDTGKYRIRQYMTDTLGYQEQFVVMPVTLYKHHHWGMAIYSRYPIVNTGEIELPKPQFNRKGSSINLCLYADIKIKHDTVRVYNVHFQSIRFGPDEYKMMLNNHLQASEENLKGMKSIAHRMKFALEMRTEQLKKVLAHTEQSSYPVLFCTDFNDTPSSWAYWQVTKQLNDSFIQKGKGFGITYSGPFPAFRIDYIFHSREMGCLEFRIIRKYLSDHYPLFARFRAEDFY